VIDVDSDAGRRLVELAQARGLDVTTVGLSDAGADVRTIACRCAAAGSQVVVARRNAADLMFELPLLGAFNVANALVAVGLAAAIGIGDDAIRAGLAAVAPVPGRLEVVADPAGRIVVVDYAHTPDALTTVLTTLRDLAPTARIVTVYGCGGDRDAAKRPLMGAAVAAGADAAVLTSDNPRSEDPAAIAAAVIGGLDADDPHPEVILDRRAAIARAITLTGPGDVVLVAGKGHERGQTALGVTTPFDDRLVAAELLAAAGREPGTGAACA
jgi:UDP-N-acetylmuramoyl-L-alanyl-D-glutamate--2,6-diaminopimelate ligase